MSLALVTGASGHLGANLVRELLDRGWRVRAFVRVASPLDGLKGLEVELAHGDLLDGESIDRAMVGVDVCFHAGAVYRNWTADEASILRPALEGTENVLRAAASAGVKRVIHTSSCNAVGFTTDPARPLDERSWNSELHLPYVRAKVESERLAWKLADELGLALITMLPTTVLGPHDHRITPTTAYVRDLLAGKAPVLPGVANLVHVRDVARAHVLAAERGRPGARYLVGGPNLPDTALQAMIAQRTGRTPAILSAPRFVLMAVATAMEFVSSLTGREPQLTPAMVRTAFGRMPCFDTSLARQDLGFEARGPEEVLDDTLAWLVRTGQLAPARIPAPA